MNFSLNRIQKQTLQLILIGSILGILYPLLAREAGNFYATLNGFIIGFIGASFIAFVEVYMSYYLRFKLSFISKLSIKTLIYSLFFGVLIIVVVSVSRSIEAGHSLAFFIENGDLAHFIFEEDFFIIVSYAFFLTGVVIFTNQISSKLGPGILWKMITGKYHTPKEEHRIFMFIDLNKSTTIAEKLGDLKYNNLLNNFFFDLSKAILRYEGEVYRYVGDEVVVTWKFRNGVKNLNFLKCFNEGIKAIDRNESAYLKKYGIKPEFTTGIGSGNVICGQVGDIKTQIVYHGDCLYETEQIQKLCKNYGVNVLISSDIIKSINSPENHSLFLIDRQIEALHQKDLWAHKTEN